MSVEVFANPEDIFVSLVVLSDEGLLTAKPSKEAIEGARNDAGEIVLSQELLGSKPKVAPYESITRVRLDRRKNTNVIVWYGKGKQATSVNFDLCDGAAQRRFGDALHARLGKGWQLEDRKLNPIQASLTPAGFAFVLALLTAGVWHLASAAERGEDVDSAGRWLRRAERLAGTLGPTGALIVGGVLVLIALLWLGVRISKPPVFQEFKRS